MSQQYASFVENVYAKFPAMKSVTKVDSSQFNKITQKELLNKGYMNFTATRPELNRLSILIEKYALENHFPLIAAFENEGRFKYAEKRYLKMLKELPMSWIIGNFNNPFLAQEFPENSMIISCVGTNMDIVWAVITRGPAGPMGLVAEEIAGEKFEGFFSVAPKIVQKAIDQANKKLRENIDVMTSFD